jgi:hypothetical protein
MPVIVGLLRLLVTGVATVIGMLQHAGAAHPLTERFLRVRLSRHSVDRHDVPLPDRGRRGGAART